MEKEELYDMCKIVIDLNKQRYVIVKDEIEKIIRDNMKDERHIQRKLDEMLDILLFYENDDSLLLFKKLCKYYFSINPQATVRYISECKLQEEELEEVKYFKIEELQDLDNEGFEWLENLKKIVEK